MGRSSDSGSIWVTVRGFGFWYPLLLITALKVSDFGTPRCVSNGPCRDLEDRKAARTGRFRDHKPDRRRYFGLWYPPCPRKRAFSPLGLWCPDGFGPSVPPNRARLRSDRTLVPPRPPVMTSDIGTPYQNFTRLRQVPFPALAALAVARPATRTLVPLAVAQRNGITNMAPLLAAVYSTPSFGQPDRTTRRFPKT
jgi:hypothetical protein